MDIDRLNRGEMIAGVSGVALLLIMFIFSWFSYELGPFGDAGFDAWESFDFIDLILLLAALAGIALAVLSIGQTETNLPVATSAIATGLGILGVLLILFRIISPPDFGTGVDADRSIGVFLGLIATAGIAIGGWMAMQEEGAALGGQRDRGTPPGGSGAPPSDPGGPPPSDPAA